MKYLILCTAIFLASCGAISVPVKRTFPEVPKVLQEKCGNLETIEGDSVKITDFLNTIVNNYTRYYECSNKVEGWQDWYTKQKEIFDSVK